MPTTADRPRRTQSRKNSPAFDAGDPTNSLRADQRGITRPQFFGPDIGAFELQDTEAPTTTISGPRKKIESRKKKVTLRADLLASEEGSTFTCDVTGGKLESDPSKCTSPLLYELPVGSKKKTTYTLEVFATDVTGNVGPPATAKTTFIKKPKAREEEVSARKIRRAAARRRTRGLTAGAAAAGAALALAPGASAADFTVTTTARLGRRQPPPGDRRRQRRPRRRPHPVRALGDGNDHRGAGPALHR